MATYHFWRRLLDENGKAVIGAEVNVYLAATTTKANIYNGTEEVLSNPLTTDNTGIFNFYIRDYSESNGYAATQKFRLVWSGENQDGEAVSGNLDRIDIYPTIFQVDETSDINTSFNKVASNDLAYDWNNHIVETYEDDVHDMLEIDYYDSVDMTPNKLVSNYLINQMWSSLASAQSPTLETTGAAITTISVGLSGSAEPVKWISEEADWESHETWPTDTHNWAGICWSPELSLFCATAWGGGDQRVMTSPDGTNWTPAIAATITNRWFSVCWSPELSIFCAVSDTGTNNRVMTSPDGTNWTSANASDEVTWKSVCWSPELSLFCAVASQNKIMTSPNGTNWTDRTVPAANAWQAICWSPDLGLFCAVAGSGVGNRVMTSSDGINWDWRVPAVDNNWYSICWSPELSLFCAVSTDGTDRVMTSPDGTNWSSTTSDPVSAQWYDIDWSPEMYAFAAISLDGKSMISYNGINWTEKTTPSGPWYGICWSPELSLFCAVHYSGATDRTITLSGAFENYYADIEHSLNIEHPVVTLFEASGAEYQPWKIESTDNTPPYNTIRVFSVLNVKTEVTVIG